MMSNPYIGQRVWIQGIDIPCEVKYVNYETAMVQVRPMRTSPFKRNIEWVYSWPDTRSMEVREFSFSMVSPLSDTALSRLNNIGFDSANSAYEQARDEGRSVDECIAEAESTARADLSRIRDNEFG